MPVAAPDKLAMKCMTVQKWSIDYAIIYKFIFILDAELSRFFYVFAHFGHFHE